MEYILTAILVASLLSGCASDATETMAPVRENQVYEVSQVDENWYQGKVFQEEETQQEQQSVEPLDSYSNIEFPEFSNWECFETFSGEDIKISMEIQSGDLVMILPEAQFIVLERNGADTGWEFINEDFTDVRVYTTVTCYGNELVVSSTEDWKWDGTYIQLPDTTE